MAKCLFMVYWTAQVAGCVISANSSCVTAFDTSSVPLLLLMCKVDAENIGLLKGRNTASVYVDAALWPSSKHSLWHRGNREREEQHAEEAHTAPVCQHSSYFITYLKAEMDGWERLNDRGCLWRKERWGWAAEGESWCPAVPSTLDHLYITLLWSVCVCVCLLRSTNILPSDKASVRCHFSETSPFMYLTKVCVNDRECGRAKGLGLCGVILRSTPSTVWIIPFACNLIRCMCHKSCSLHMYSKEMSNLSRSLLWMC